MRAALPGSRLTEGRAGLCGLEARHEWLDSLLMSCGHLSLKSAVDVLGGKYFFFFFNFLFFIEV